MVMKELKLIHILLLCVGLSSVVSLSAQEHKRVEVTTIYTPEITPKTKLDVPASISESSEIEPDIIYNIHPDTWQIKLADHNFKPARAGYWDFNRTWTWKGTANGKTVTAICPKLKWEK